MRLPKEHLVYEGLKGIIEERADIIKAVSELPDAERADIVDKSLKAIVRLPGYIRPDNAKIKGNDPDDSYAFYIKNLLPIIARVHKDSNALGIVLNNLKTAKQCEKIKNILSYMPHVELKDSDIASIFACYQQLSEHCFSLYNNDTEKRKPNQSYAMWEVLSSFEHFIPEKDRTVSILGKYISIFSINGKAAFPGHYK